jgi:hypothetical protein
MRVILNIFIYVLIICLVFAKKPFMRAITLLIGTTLLCIFYSCETTSLPEPKADDHWVYKYTDYDGSGNVVTSYNLHFTATGFDKEVGGGTTEQWVSMHNDSVTFPGILIPQGDYRMRSGGLYYLTELSLGGVPSLMAKYPGSVGDNFTVGSTVSPMDGSIISINSTVTVPAGTFTNLHCYSLSYQGEPIGNLWFNDSVWFVRYDELDSLASGTGMYVNHSCELVSYTQH